MSLRLLYFASCTLDAFVTPNNTSMLIQKMILLILSKVSFLVCPLSRDTMCTLMVGLYWTLPEPRSKLQAMNRSMLTVKYGCAMDSLISNENGVFLSSAHSQCVNLTESGL